MFTLFDLNPARLRKSYGAATFAGESWWAYLDLNQGPRPYQGRALTN